jgi:CRP-like cAMP-binding protein
MMTTLSPVTHTSSTVDGAQRKKTRVPVIPDQLSHFASPRARRVFDAERHGERVDTVRSLAELPRPPIGVQGGSVFMTANYRRVVSMKRREVQQREALAVRARFTQDLQGPPETIVSEEAAKAAAAQRQKQWFAISEMVKFVIIHERIAKVSAMNTLRQLLGPVIRRARIAVRRNHREALILHVCQNEMAPLSAVELQQTPFFRRWPLDAVIELLPQCTPMVALAGSRIIPHTATAAYHHDVCIVDNGAVDMMAPVTPDARSSNFAGEVPVLPPLHRFAQRMEVFGELSIVDDMPYAEFRVHTSRLLYWRVARADILALWNKLSTQSRIETACEVRALYIPWLNPPAPASLQNCGSNTFFTHFCDHDIAQLQLLLRPVSFPEGHAIYAPGDDATFFFFVVRGMVDVLEPDVGASTADGSIAMLRTARLGPWSCIGHEGVTTVDKRSSLVRAATVVDAWVCQRTAFLELLMSNAALFLDLKALVRESNTERMLSKRDKLFAALRCDSTFAALHADTLRVAISKAVPQWSAAGETVQKHDSASFLVLTQGVARLRAAATGDAPPELSVLVTGPAVVNAPQAITSVFPRGAKGLVAATPIETWEIRSATVLFAADEAAARQPLVAAAEKMLWRDVADLS